VSHLNVLGLRRPIDGGRTLRNGTRLLGDGKTWQGLLAAVLGGTLTGLVLEQSGLGDASTGALLGFLAIIGDMAGSFTKRRLGMSRGANAGLLDQIDFISLAILGSLHMFPWEVRQVALLLILTPLVHRGANIIAYAAGLKDVPW
jgi:CDP-2,3-bis-(O-geranylgeranyl)-sn-glycerol synthase